MLKVIAIASMLADHLNILLLGSEYEFLFWFGRLALPLFCYLLVAGFTYTSDVLSYIRRLLFFAFLAQPIYIWAFDYPMYQLNILFSLTLALWVLSRLRDIGPFYFVVLLLLAAFLLEGGVQVVCLVMAFYFIVCCYGVLLPDLRLALSRWLFYIFYPLHLFLLRLFV